MVADARVLESGGLSPDALQQLRSAVAKWNFRPFTKDGRPVHTMATFSLTWDAQGRPRMPALVAQ